MPDPGREAARRGQLRKGRQQDAGLTKPVDGAMVGVAVDDVVLESQGGHGQNPVITEKPSVSKESIAASTPLAWSSGSVRPTILAGRRTPVATSPSSRG